MPQLFFKRHAVTRRCCKPRIVTITNSSYSNVSLGTDPLNPARTGCRSGGRDCEIAAWRFSVAGKQNFPRNASSRVEHPVGLPMQYHYAPCLDPWRGWRLHQQSQEKNADPESAGAVVEAPHDHDDSDSVEGGPRGGGSPSYRPPEAEAARIVQAVCVPSDWHAPPLMSNYWRLQWVVVLRSPARVTLTRMAEEQIYKFDSESLREAVMSTIALTRWVALRYGWHMTAGGSLGTAGGDDDDLSAGGGGGGQGRYGQAQGLQRRDLRPRTLLWYYEDLEARPLPLLKMLARFLRWDPDTLNELQLRRILFRAYQDAPPTFQSEVLADWALLPSRDHPEALENAVEQADQFPGSIWYEWVLKPPGTEAAGEGTALAQPQESREERNVSSLLDRVTASVLDCAGQTSGSNTREFVPETKFCFGFHTEGTNALTE